MPPRGNRNDPYKNFNFLIEIDGIQQGGFMECLGLESETEVIEYREGADLGPARKLPGLTHYSNIVLTRGITGSLELWQ